MGKRDRKDFGQNPFSVLKGFSASPPPRPAAAAAPPTEVPPVTVPEEGDFGAAMEWLGVRRLPGAAVEPPLSRPEEPQPVAAVPRPPLDEGEEFRRALGALPPAFRDELPDEEPVPAAPRLTRLVRRGTLRPEATLDLHGVTRGQLRDKLRWFLEDGCYQGLRLLLIVTGRGKSSGGDPVLRGEVERYLRHDAAAWVAEWDRAPGRYGGEGALLVLLKARKP